VLVALIPAATFIAANLILRKYEITADLIDRMKERGGGSLDRESR
jgi:hypothetical protein